MRINLRDDLPMQQVSFGVWEKDDRRVFAATHSGNDRTGEKMDIASYGKQKPPSRYY
jgi:hypothetical protein